MNINIEHVETAQTEFMTRKWTNSLKEPKWNLELVLVKCSFHRHFSLSLIGILNQESLMYDITSHNENYAPKIIKTYRMGLSISKF